MVEGDMDSRLRKLKNENKPKSNLKRRWICHIGIDKKILDIVKQNKDITTSGILLKLKDKNINVTWKLVNSHLVEFKQNKKVKRIQIGDKHKINFWNLA